MASCSSRVRLEVSTHGREAQPGATLLLKAALATPAGYLGALGSRRTHAKRTKQLLEEGVTAEEIARTSGPIGLDIGAHTPEEVAVATAAEIIALRTGASGRRLSYADGPIHKDPAPLL